MDGKLLLATNVPDLSPEQIVARYKALAEIERGFRVLKSEIEIAPVIHRLPNRIRAHALICFLALVLYRVLRLRLKAKGSPYSPERALEITRRIQLHQVTLHNRHTANGLSTLLNNNRIFSPPSIFQYRPIPLSTPPCSDKFQYPLSGLSMTYRKNVSNSGETEVDAGQVPTDRFAGLRLSICRPPGGTPLAAWY